MHGYSKVCNRLNKKDEDSRYNEEEKKSGNICKNSFLLKVPVKVYKDNFSN